MESVLHNILTFPLLFESYFPISIRSEKTQRVHSWIWPFFKGCPPFWFKPLFWLAGAVTPTLNQVAVLPYRTARLEGCCPVYLSSHWDIFRCDSLGLATIRWSTHGPSRNRPKPIPSTAIIKVMKNFILPPHPKYLQNILFITQPMIRVKII